MCPFILLAATNNLSETSLVAPYKLIGQAALSVDKEMTLSTPRARDASMTLIAPLIFVLMHSIGLYSAVGTCLRAAAWITKSTSSIAILKRAASRTSPIK
ncbi:MAG: hypothetical protein ACD_46C00479G0003 [uncultured bacterium]|nr:MAG: hypothetical protein ACD_46C00479G0003 [uncultured bacterium]